jgi:uncharacterized membrane protein HdeD (DUF308 family)
MTSISDLSDSMSVAGQTLSTPLLGNLPEHEGDECEADYDEEEGCMPCSQVSGDDDSTQPSRWNDNCDAWVVLSALLSLQFGMLVLYMAGAKKATTTTDLQWTLMIYGIVLFVAIAMFYHRTVKACKMTSTVVLVAPEILLNIILGLAMLEQLDAALLFMLFSISGLAILVTVISIRGVIATRSSAEEDDCKQLQDKRVAGKKWSSTSCELEE